MAINSVSISGNLTRDPELRSTASGMQVLSFCVAVNDRRKNPQTGTWEDYANYIDCTMFGTRAESVNTYLQKGSKVAIEGKLHWSQWEKDGQKRSKVDVTVEEIVFMSNREQQAYTEPQQAYPQTYQQPYQQPQAYQPQAYQQPAFQPNYQQAYQQQPTQQAQTVGLYDEDIPF